MSKLLTIIFKNYKLIIRSRVSALITIFGPLIIMLLVGMAFNNASNYSISIGVFANEYTELVNSFLDKLSEAQFNVVKQESEQSCKDNLRQGVVNICMVFPENFEFAKPDKTRVSNEINFYVDPSRMNLVDSVIDMISTKVASRTQEISSELTSVILNTLDNTQSSIAGQDQNFVDLLQTNEDIKAKESGIKNKLGVMDFDFDSTQFGVSDLIKLNTSITNTIIGENSSINELINESLDLINEILIDIEASSLNGSTTEGDIEDLQDSLEDMQEEMEDLSEESFEDLSKTIINIENQLTITKNKFKSAKNSRLEITREISEINELIEFSQNKIMAVKAGFEDINKDIESIQVTDSDTIVSPIRTKITEEISETYLNYMFPSLIALVVMLVALLFSTTVVIMEKQSKAYFRNSIIPIPSVLYLIAAFFSTLILLAVQLILILGVSSFVFNLNILSNIVTTTVISFGIITVFSLIGILIGVVFSSAETATLASVSFGSLCLFLSDVILPLESMPSTFIDIARFNPFVISEFLLRRSLLFNTTLETVVKEGYFISPISALVLLILYSLLFVSLIWIMNTIIRKHIFSKYARKFAPKHIEKVIDTTDKNLDSVQETENLLTEAWEMIKIRDYKQAKLLYYSINELYTMLPKKNKKEVFQKIVKLKERLDKIHD